MSTSYKNFVSNLYTKFENVIGVVLVPKTQDMQFWCSIPCFDLVM